MTSTELLRSILLRVESHQVASCQCASCLASRRLSEDINEHLAQERDGEQPKGPPNLFVEARITNDPGVFRVVSMAGYGNMGSNRDAAAILHKLADWIEAMPRNKPTDLTP